MTTVLVSLPWAAIVAALLILGHNRDQNNAVERADLLQRIQAPAAAIAQHVAANEPDPVAEDDEIEDPTFTNIP